MRPLYLKFCGINSFSETAEIDFEKLTKNGLFGIFGDTGSGKSTILDAINFALYGEVERSKEKSEMINYKSQSASVEFSFKTQEKGKTIVYAVERVLKKDKSGTHKAKLFRQEEDKEECIADKPQTVKDKVTEILGVNQEDFRKCIAIPQGEFSEFVKSTQAERLRLIERLFSLQRYGDGLKNKINRSLDVINGEYNNIQGQIEVYKDDTPENLKLAKEELLQKEKGLKQVKLLSQVASEEYEKVKSLHAKWAELKDKSGYLLKLQEKSQEMTELKGDLSRLEICRKIVADNKKLADDRVAYSKISEDIARIKGERQTNSDKYNALKAEFDRSDFDNKLNELHTKKTSYSYLSEKTDRLNGIGKQLEQKRGLYKNCDDVRKTLEAEIKRCDEELKNLVEQLKSSADTDINSLISVYYKNAFLREEYARELGWLTDFRLRSRRYEDDSETYGFIEKELDGKISYYKERLAELKEYSFALADSKLKGLNDFNSKLDSLNQKIATTQKEQATSKEKLSYNLEKLAEHKADGVELKNQYDCLKEEIESVLGKGVDLKTANQILESQIVELNKSKKGLSEELEKLNKSISNNDITLNGLQTLLGVKQREIDDNSKSISASLQSIDFDLKRAEELVQKYSSYADAAKSLDDYEKEVYSTNEAVKALSSIENIASFDDEKLRLTQEAKDIAQRRLSEESGNFKVLEDRKSQLEARLKEKERILATFKDVEKRRNLYSQLRDLTRSNRFLEFVANEYLCEISALASKTLITLTDGRYYLVYRNENFSVCDNYDSGNLRGVNTLSGGETFLVSLSLALALSQTICSRSLKSIEFFFLDEGFGTLDSNLIDVVMNALEKLKSSNFTIGVISHVEELKHRIDCKITVNKATESRGSTIQMSL